MFFTVSTQALIPKDLGRAGQQLLPANLIRHTWRHLHTILRLANVIRKTELQKSPPPNSRFSKMNGEINLLMVDLYILT